MPNFRSKYQLYDDYFHNPDLRMRFHSPDEYVEYHNQYFHNMKRDRSAGLSIQGFDRIPNPLTELGFESEELIFAASRPVYSNSLYSSIDNVRTRQSTEYLLIMTAEGIQEIADLIRNEGNFRRIADEHEAMVRKNDDDEDLRANNPALQTVWEKYQALKLMCNE